MFEKSKPFQTKQEGCSCTGKSREFSTNTPVLERPQGVQRRLLRVGEASDARDIESLVGSILPQRLELLATVQIPEHNGSIIPAARQSAAIRTYLERLDGPLMRFSHPHALPALHLPPAQHSVTASTEQQLSTRSPAQRRDHPRMLSTVGLLGQIVTIVGAGEVRSRVGTLASPMGAGAKRQGNRTRGRPKGPHPSSLPPPPLRGESAFLLVSQNTYP